jgi:pimeloyl-ACP methyl ester carboxylesterase
MSEQVDGNPGGDAGTTVEVKGRRLYLECAGTGSPAVVLQHGFGAAADVWSFSETAAPAVQPELATTNRVCSYDRPGAKLTTIAPVLQRGRSDSVPMPRDPAAVVTELHDLLAAADVPGPYVMVGHSLGGTLSVLYARTYPDQVCALVVVDSPQPPLRGLISAKAWETARILSFPPDVLPGYEHESYDLQKLFEEIEAAGPLPGIPVVDVRRGEVRMFDGPPPEGWTQAELDAANKAQREAQVLWAKSVPGAEVITVPGTTHDIHTQRPDAVVAAIRGAIART